MSDDLSLEDLPQPEFEGTVPVDDLETDGDNPNEMSDEQFGLLIDRMRSEGWLGGPILTNTDGVIADGEHRWRAAQELGLAEVPVRQFNIDEADRRLWRQEMNKNRGEHDKKRDALEYDYLLNNGKSDAVADLTDAADEDLDDLLAEIRVNKSSSIAYEYDVEHDVHFMDCIDGMQEHLEDDSVDMVFTSPPYNVEKTQSGDRKSEAVAYTDDRTEKEFREFLGAVFSELVRVTKPDGHIFINLDQRYGEGKMEKHDWVHDLVGLPLRSVIVWKKRPVSSSLPSSRRAIPAGLGTNLSLLRRAIRTQTSESTECLGC
ncbi:DNA methyltransferase [Haladaptatus cibarius]|uniref:DNA methyltransferase n=1 Tax=Haladaptatus cibarius TaxID=453847 RepID=UPI000679E12C|nr:DNA methyltransferase [Haladaptatus cibarius]